jgi:hypothetical protein
MFSTRQVWFHMAEIVLLMLVFWVVMRCGFTGGYQHFRGTHGVTTQKINININTTMRTSNLI